MARSEKQLANLKRGNPETQFKRGRCAVENQKKAVKNQNNNRRRHKSLEETVRMVSNLPLDDLGLTKAKRSGLNLEGVDAYDLTAMTAVVLGQIRAAAAGSSQAARNVADWMELEKKHEKQRLENEKLKAEIEKLNAEIERLHSGLGADDDDKVLLFIEGMKDDNPDT